MHAAPVTGTHAALMAAAIVTGLVVAFFTLESVGAARWQRLAVAMGAFTGGMLGAKLPFALLDPRGPLALGAWTSDGKTILSGLVGGYAGACAVEALLGIAFVSCDGFAAPVAAGVAVGRLACFSSGCCHGTGTALPWGVDFGDGLLRHPTQLYETLFHGIAAILLVRAQRRGAFRGHLVRVYLVAYCLFRFATEFIRPGTAIGLGLTAYQLASLVLIPVFVLRCCPGAPFARSAGAVRGLAPPPGASCTWLKATGTLCPRCLAPVTGTTFELDGRVYLNRMCPEHGPAMALACSDRRHYHLRHEVGHPPPAGLECCPDPAGHRTCVALLEITDHCDLACGVCYSSSHASAHRPFEELRADLEACLGARGPLDVLQISGGEPTTHPDLLRVIDLAKALGVDHVMLNTNGLELARRPDLVRELAARRPRLELNLQFDGVTDAVHRELRGRDLLAEKRRALDLALEHGVPVTLVCTVVRAVNEPELGALLELGIATRGIRGITFQPCTFAGRLARPIDPLDRVTLADVIRRLVEQSHGLLVADDFKPLPCSNPNCCSFTMLARPQGGPVVPLMRVVSYEEHLERLADRLSFKPGDARGILKKDHRPDDFFRIFIKPFMDAHTYDADRVAECCVHVITRGGKAVSFCRHNVLERGEGKRT